MISPIRDSAGSITSYVAVQRDVTHADINALAQRYQGDDPEKVAESIRTFEEHVRISFRFVPNGYYTSLEE